MLALSAFKTIGTLPYCAFSAVRTTSDIVRPLRLIRSMSRGLLSLLQRSERVTRLLRNCMRDLCMAFDVRERA